MYKGKYEKCTDWVREVGGKSTSYSSDIYHRGLELVSEFAPKHIYHLIIKAPVNPYKRKLLHTQVLHTAKRYIALADAAMVSDKKKHIRLEVEIAPWSDLKISRIDWEVLPDPLKKRYVEKGKIFSTACLAHRDIRNRNAPASQNAIWASTIVEGFSDIQAIWDEIDYFITHKSLPAAAQKKSDLKKEIPNTPEEIRKQLAVRRSNIYTYEKRLAGCEQPAKIQKLQIKLDQLRQEVEFLKGKL